MEDGSVLDSQITASSEWGVHSLAIYGRLDQSSQPSNYTGTGAWSPQFVNENQWIQADLGAQKMVTGVMLQGREDCCHQYPQFGGQWVTKFKVEYSDDEENWEFVQHAHNQSDMVSCTSTEAQLWKGVVSNWAVM